MRILVVEDEKNLCTLLEKYLTSQGYTVDKCFDGEDALYYLEDTEYDAVVLDIMLPKVDGITVLKTIRAKGNHTHVLLLTAKNSVEDRIVGLDSGADDYLGKPFDLEELAARLRVLIRRGGVDRTDNILQVRDLTLDTQTKAAYRNDKEIKLTAKEYAVLEYLMHNKGIVLSRQKIEQHIWNYDYVGGSNVVDVYIRTLRMKLDDGGEPLIQTVRGMGYVIK